MALGIEVALVAVLCCCTLREGSGGEPITAPRRYLLVGVIGAVAIETGNPEVAAARYAYQAVESFDLTVVSVADTLGGGGDDRYPYQEQQRAALKRAEAEIAKLGVCAQLVDARAEKVGWQHEPRRFSSVTKSDGVELTAEQLAGLCAGGPLP